MSVLHTSQVFYFSMNTHLTICFLTFPLSNFNPSHISMYIPHTVLYTLPEVLARRIKELLLSLIISFIIVTLICDPGMFCKGKLYASHSLVVIFPWHIHYPSSHFARLSQFMSSLHSWRGAEIEIKLKGKNSLNFVIICSNNRHVRLKLILIVDTFFRGGGRVA